MKSQGLKVHITITLVFLLALGMLLVNVVMVTFWQRSLVQAKVKQVRTVLSLMGEQGLAGEKVPEHELVKRLSWISHLLAADCVMASVDGVGQAFSVGPCQDKGLLVASLGQVDQNGSGYVQLVGQYPLRFLFRKKYLMVAMPVRRDLMSYYSVGALLSLEPVYDQIRKAQKIILIYCLVNLIILTVVGLFRFMKVIVRPIEKLADLSDSTATEDGVPFFSSRASNEFGRLSGSLNRMLTRIDKDRATLKKTVGSLENANQQLLQNQKEMIQTEKLAAIGRLSAGLAHEVGNPLGIVQGYLEMLGESGLAPDERKQFSGRSIQELERINRLIRQLLDFSRSRVDDLGQIMVHALLRELVDMLQAQKKMAMINFVFRFEAEDDVVAVRGEGLRQVFLNCLLNGIDAIRECPAHHTGEITVSTAIIENIQKGRMLQIAIADNGAGIDEKDMKNLFDPFFTTKEPGKGTGLGLSVSHTIVEGAGGHIEVVSEVGQGTTVSVVLPLLVVN